MNLALDIAWIHVRTRVRQTGFAIAGVATGVGFSVMMAALMQGSQDDFISRLVNTLPHVTVSDERRSPPLQPAETMFDTAEFHGLTPEVRRRGIKNPLAMMAALEAWVPGGVAPTVRVQAIVRYANRDVGTNVIGIDPNRESKVSDLPKQMRGATLAALYRATNAIVLGDRLAEKIGARVGANITIQTSEGARISSQWSVFSTRESAKWMKVRLTSSPRPGKFFPSRQDSSTNCAFASTIRWRRAISRNVSRTTAATNRCLGWKRTKIF
jgi:lipoprotein-releasing system permease protein